MKDARNVHRPKQAISFGHMLASMNQRYEIEEINGVRSPGFNPALDFDKNTSLPSIHPFITFLTSIHSWEWSISSQSG